MTQEHNTTVVFKLNTDAWTFIDVMNKKGGFIGSQLCAPGGGTYYLNDWPTRTGYIAGHGYTGLEYDVYLVKDGPDGIPVAHQLLPLSVHAMQLGPGRCEVTIKNIGRFQESASVLLKHVMSTYPEVREQLEPEHVTEQRAAKTGVSQSVASQSEEAPLPDNILNLTDRQCEAANYIADGYTQMEVALKMDLTKAGVEKHASSIRPVLKEHFRVNEFQGVDSVPNLLRRAGYGSH